MARRGGGWKLASAPIVGVVALAAGSIVGALPASASTVSTTFASTGAVQLYTVPAGICGVTLEAIGGSGGAVVTNTGSIGLSKPGGRAADVAGHLATSPGTQLQIFVGGAGLLGGLGVGGGDGGTGGGGGGGLLGGAGGGGASVVYNTAGPLVVAGGGGGRTYDGLAAGGNAGLLHHHALDGASNADGPGGGGGTTGGVGGTGSASPSATYSNGGGGGTVSGGASAAGGTGGSGTGGLSLIGGGGGAGSTPTDVHPGSPAGPGQTGAGGHWGVAIAISSGTGGDGIAPGGNGADSSTNAGIGGDVASGGGGGGGVGFGGGGGATFGGGGGAGLGGGGGGTGGGGGGSSWAAPWITSTSSALAPNLPVTHDGSVTVSYDPATDACPPVVVPGSATVTAPTSGTTELDIPVTLSVASTQTVTAQWTTAVVPGDPAGQAPTTDYIAAGGTVTFSPGQTTATIPITVTANSTAAPEFLVVSFTNPTNAVIGGFWGLGVGIIDPGP